MNKFEQVLVQTIKVGSLALGVFAVWSPQSARAASFGFGCSDDPNCQYYTGYTTAQILSEGFVSGKSYGGLDELAPVKGSSLAPPIYLNNYSTVLASGLILSSARLTGTANFGSLKGTAMAGALSGGSEVSSNARAFGILGWGDTFTLTSDTLPVGAMVPVAFRLDLDRTVDARELPYGLALANADLRLSYGGGSTSLYVFDSTYAPDEEQSMGTYELPIGLPFSVEGQLLLDARASAFNGSGSSFGYVDAGHTANYYITPLSSDVTYTTASGGKYFAPSAAVPEPTTSPALLLGLIGLGWGVLRKRKHKQIEQAEVEV